MSHTYNENDRVHQNCGNNQNHINAHNQGSQSTNNSNQTNSNPNSHNIQHSQYTNTSSLSNNNTTSLLHNNSNNIINNSHLSSNWQSNRICQSGIVLARANSSTSSIPREIQLPNGLTSSFNINCNNCEKSNSNNSSSKYCTSQINLLNTESPRHKIDNRMETGNLHENLEQINHSGPKNYKPDLRTIVDIVNRGSHTHPNNMETGIHNENNLHTQSISCNNTQNINLNENSRNIYKNQSTGDAPVVPPVANTLMPLNIDLQNLFECPVCIEISLPPIYQCPAGHIVCKECKGKVRGICPQCRMPLGNIRNRAMEQLASTISFPCKHKTNGCPEIMDYKSKYIHEEDCEYRPYICPCPGAACRKPCQQLIDVLNHLQAAHKSITTLQGEDIVFLATDINLPGAVDWVMMQSCFDNNFMLVLEKQEKADGRQMFYAIVQLIGTRRQAENFAYRLELNGQRRRLTWEATPMSIHDGVQQAIIKSDCLVFDSNTAQMFSENGNLGINVTISICNVG